MIVLYPTVLAAAAAILIAGSLRRAGRTGWPWFAAWAAAGAVFSFSFLAGLSIGLLVLPLAAGLLLAVAVQAPRLPEALGFAAGTGLTLLLVAYRNRGYAPCDPHGSLSLPAGSPPGTIVSCGGIDPTPWLLAGIALTATPALVYALLRRHRSS